MFTIPNTVQENLFKTLLLSCRSNEELVIEYLEEVKDKYGSKWETGGRTDK